MLKTYGQGAYSLKIKAVEKRIDDTLKRVNERMGVKESDTGLEPPHLWDLEADRMRGSEGGTLQVARCTKIIKPAAGGVEGGETSEHQFVINVKQIGKFVVGVGKKVSPEDIEEGMRVGYHLSFSYYLCIYT
jgi:26S proteasome regulatory subunit T1